jgi:hypothetical protein
MSVVLTQKNAESNEIPIAFMSSSFKGVDLNYPVVDQHAYAVFKEVKHFRSYLLKSRTKVIVPYPVVRNLLVQKELGEKWTKWMTSLQEYDLEITPTQIVRGQGLCKLVVDSVEEKQSQINVLTVNQHSQNQIYCTQVVANSWFDDIKFYLTHGSSPHHLNPKKSRALRLKSAPFQLVNGVLFCKNFDNVLMRKR